MRILLLLNGRFPTEKAYGIQTITMAEGYLAAGHEVAIAYPRRSEERPASIEVGGKHVTFLPFGSLRRLTFSRLFSFLRFLGALEARSVVRSFRPDFVIANDPWQAAMLSRDVPVVWELHDLPNLRRWTRRILVRVLLRHVQGIVSTNVLKIDALRRLREALPPVTVIPNAVTFDPDLYRRIGRSEAREKLSLPEEEFCVVYAGQLFDWKGVDTLVASARYLTRSVVIHIVGGSGSDLERCRSTADQLPPGSAKVVFYGQRPKEEIPLWLRAASVVVIPNSGKFEISARDTSPLKLFEALAAGAAVIASDLPSIREVAADSAAVSFFLPDDPGSLATCVEALMDAPLDLESMRLNAEEFPVRTSKDRAEAIIDFCAGLREMHSLGTV